MAELTTGVLCVSFPEMGVLFKKSTWATKKASTAIVEGRHREEDTVYQGPSQFKRFTTSITTHGTVSGSTKVGSHWGGTQLELDEMNLIGGQGGVESRDGTHKDQHHQQQQQQWRGNVEVTREVRIDSSSMVSMV